MNSDTICRRFYNEVLELEDVKEYLRERSTSIATDHQLEHVSRCFYAVYEFYVDRDRVPGEFVKGLILDQFRRTVGCADDTNRSFLPTYAMLMHNCVPIKIHGELKADLKDQERTRA